MDHLNIRILIMMIPLWSLFVEKETIEGIKSIEVIFRFIYFTYGSPDKY